MQTTQDTIEIPDNVQNELKRLKEYFPFRIVWCAVKDCEWVTGADLTRRNLNKYIRAGYSAFVLD